MRVLWSGTFADDHARDQSIGRGHHEHGEQHNRDQSRTSHNVNREARVGDRPATISWIKPTKVEIAVIMIDLEHSLADPAIRKIRTDRRLLSSVSKATHNACSQI